MKKIEAYIQAFEVVCSKHKDFGASDTEPDTVFQLLVSSAAAGSRPEVPYTPTGWDLMRRDETACDRAAQRLHMAARKVITAIEACPIRDAHELKDFVRKYCWRLG